MLDKKIVKKYINKAESVLGGNLEIKGFRKGKAPKELFKKHLDSGRVKALALEIAVQDSLSDIIKDSSLDVLDTSQLSIEKNDSAQLKYSRSNFINKDDGEIAEEGDRVEIDFEARKNDQIIEGGISKNHPLIIGGRSFISGFEDKLTGMKKGEEKSFSLPAPADYFYKEVAGKELTFKVKMNDIKEVVRPEANDDFARSLGRFASLRELKESVKEGLTQETIGHHDL